MKKLITRLSFLVVLCSLLSASKIQAQVTLFSENWSTSSYATNSWTFTPAQSNWTGWATYTPTGAATPNAFFSWSPTITGYSVSLVSPIISSAAYINLTLDYKLQLNNFSTATLEQFKVEYKTVASAVWTTLTNYTNTGTFNVALVNQSLAGTNGNDIQIRFTAYGANSFNINGWGLDDIIVKGIPGTPCAGQPTAGTASVVSTCPTVIALTGVTLAANINIQWQKRLACGGTWTDIPGATGYNYAIGSQTAATEYRAFVVCTNSNLADTGNIVALASVAPCYCASAATTTGDEEIIGVTVGSLVSSSSCATTGGAGSMINQYSDYTSVYPALDLIKGATVPYTIQIGTCGGNFSSGTAFFIDYNIDGDFTDAGEQVYSTPATTNGPYTIAGNFVVPTGAASGLTRLRVINAEGFSGATITPCLSYGFGETEDYAINIMYAPTVVGAGTFCSGQDITLVATAPGISGQTEFFWKLADGSYSPGDSLIISNALASQTGIYTAYVITFPCGGGAGDTSGPKAVNIWVNQTPGPPVVDPVITYCQFAAFDSIPIFGQNLKWYSVPVGGVANTVPPTVNTSIFSSATYYVSQTIAGCESARVPVTINVVPQAPVPGVISPVGYCQGDVPIPLQATGQNIRWYSVATGGVGTPITPTPSTNAQGTFTWYATQTIDGCESARVPVEVNVSYRPNALILADRPYVCQYDTMSVFYFGNALPNADYIWTLPTGATVVSGSGQGPLVIRFDTAGIQRVLLVVDNQGCVGPQAYLDIPVRLAPVVQIDMQPDGCQGDVINLAISYSTPGVDFYTWDFAGGTVVYGAVTVGPYGIRWDSPGDKVVTTIATDDLCKSLPETDTIKVHELPDAHILPPGQICAGDSVRLQAAVIDPSYTYQWAPQQFFGESHEPIQWAVVDFPRQVFLTVTSDFNCRSTDSLLINAAPCCEVYLPSAFSPNADGKNDVFRMLTIRAGHAQNDHETGHHQITTFRVHNRWGQKVFETADETKGWDGTLGGAPQDMGTYFYYVKYKCADGKFYEQKGEVILVR